MNIRGEPDLQAFRIHIEPNTGVPRAVTVNANDIPRNRDESVDVLLERIAAHIRTSVGDRLFNSLGSSFAQTLQHVTGMVQMANLTHGGKRAIRQNVRLRNVTGSLLGEMLDSANNPLYNQDLDIYHVMFNFLINPYSIYVGGSTDVPSKFKGCHPKTLSTMKATYLGSDIRPNCAVFALKYLKFFEDNPDRTRRQTAMRRKSFWSDLAIDAHIDQGLLGWDAYVSIERVREYLRFIPDHRIVVLVPSVDNHSTFDYKGDDYIYR